MDYSYMPEHDLTVWEFGGKLDDAVLDELSSLLPSAPHWSNASRAFVDMSATESVRYSPAKLRSFARTALSLFSPKSHVRVAALAQSFAIHDMLSKWAMAFSARDASFNLFGTIEECAEFLDVPLEALRASRAHRDT